MKKPDVPTRFPAKTPGLVRRQMRRRALLAGAVLAPLAIFSATYSLAVATDTGQPEVSQQLYDGLPRAKERLGDLAIADALATPGGTGAAQATANQPRQSSETALNLSDRMRAVIEARAMSGLLDTPYSSGALRQLALLERDPARRRNLLDLSRTVSRRDVGAAAQLAELQFLTGEYEEGLATLETALTISDALDERIFPLMLRASRNRRFAALLRGSLARDPVWIERLARHASRTPESAPYLAAIAGGFPASSRALSLDYGGPLIDRLARDLQASAAFAAYEVYSDGAQDVAAFGTRPLAPLDWQLIDNIETGARLIGSGGRVAELFARPRRTGQVARIILRLPPGQHTISLSLSDPRGSGAELTLQRTCLEDGREGETASVETLLSTGETRLAFDVPDGCPFQWLHLGIAAGGDSYSVLVESVSIESDFR